MADVSEVPWLCLLVFRTGRMEEMVAFYRAAGLDLRAEQHGSGPLHYAAGVGGMVVEIYPKPGDPGGSADATMAGLRVDSVDAVATALRALGSRVIVEPKDGPRGRRAVVADPDGRLVELTEAAERLRPLAKA